MSEYHLQFIAFGKIVWSAVFSLFYGLGGVSNKWIRRFIGPLWMGVGVALFSNLQGKFEWWLLAYPALLCAALHIGYGGTDETSVKIRKRLVYGLAIGVSALPLGFSSGLWILFGFHLMVCMSVSVLLGVWNITDSARSEESLIAALSSILPLFLI